MKSKVLFGELAKRVRHGAEDSQCDRSVSDRVPSEAIADGVDARSAAERAIPLSLPGRRCSSANPSGSSSCSSGCSSRFDTEIARSEMVFSSGCCASTVRTSSSAISARIAVVEIGAPSVTERLRSAGRRSEPGPSPFGLAGTCPVAGCKSYPLDDAASVGKRALQQACCRVLTVRPPILPADES